MPDMFMGRYFMNGRGILMPLWSDLSESQAIDIFITPTMNDSNSCIKEVTVAVTKYDESFKN